MNHQDFFCDFLSIFADPSKRIWSKVTQNVKFPQKTRSKVNQKQVCRPFWMELLPKTVFLAVILNTSADIIKKKFYVHLGL